MRKKRAPDKQNVHVPRTAVVRVCRDYPHVGCCAGHVRGAGDIEEFDVLALSEDVRGDGDCGVGPV